MKKNTAIVIPVHNEEKNIPILLDGILNLDEDLSIIVVNDNSTDNSKEVTEKIAKREKGVKVVTKSKQEGLHAAIIYGLKEAMKMNVEGVITMDGDLSHLPEEIPGLIKHSEKNDLVIGSRFIPGGKTINWSSRKKIMSFFARKLSKLLLGIKTIDCSSGFKYYSISFLKSLNFEEFTTRGYAFQLETVLRAENKGLNIKEVPIQFKGRIHGKSKVDFHEVKRYLKSLLSLIKLKKSL